MGFHRHCVGVFTELVPCLNFEIGWIFITVCKKTKIITKARKLEVAPRETLRMSDTFRYTYIYIYVYDIASVYIANRRGARVSSGIWRNLAISISATRHRSECISVWKFITTDTSVKKFCFKQRDLRIGAAYSQFGHLGAKCPSLDAKIVNKVQNYID